MYMWRQTLHPWQNFMFPRAPVFCHAWPSLWKRHKKRKEDERWVRTFRVGHFSSELDPLLIPLRTALQSMKRVSSENIYQLTQLSCYFPSSSKVCTEISAEHAVHWLPPVHRLLTLRAEIMMVTPWRRSTKDCARNTAKLSRNTRVLSDARGERAANMKNRLTTQNWRPFGALCAKRKWSAQDYGRSTDISRSFSQNCERQRHSKCNRISFKQPQS